MTRAACLYRVHLTVAVAGGLAALLGLLVAVDAATAHRRSPAGVVSAVAVSQPPAAGAQAALIVLLGAIAGTTLLFGVRAIAVECRAQIRARRLLGTSSQLTLADQPVWVTRDERPLAFCYGLLRPRVYVSEGAVAMLGRVELAALISHECHHARRRDPLRLAVARVLGGALFFLGVLPRILERYTRQAELAADEAVLRDGGDIAALAGVMLAFDERGAGVDPARIDQLIGSGADHRLPLGWLMSAVAIIAALLAVGVAAASGLGHGPQLPGMSSTAASGLAVAVMLVLLGGLVAWRREAGPR